MIGLRLLDLLLTLLHFVIIGVNLLGWIWKRTRKLHLIVVGVTAVCWFILGIWFGIGYCPITDWDWQVREKLGQHDLPNSFIKYYVDMIAGHSVNPNLIDILTAAGFFMAMVLAVYFNFIQKKKKIS